MQCLGGGEITLVNIIQDFIPKGRRNRPGYSMVPKYITIHDTGNNNAGATAKMHDRYVKGDSAASVPASWHFTVDDKEVYQHLPLSENGWHAGDGANGPGNRQSIGIEICMNKDGNRELSEINAAWLCAKLIKETPSLLNFPACMKQHYDWSRKNCPQVIRGSAGGWEGFLGQVKGFLGVKGGGDIDMLKVAIVVNSLVDVLVVEPLAKKLDAPIFLRGACGQLNAETVIVAGGDGKLFERPGVQVVNLSGKDRWLTASNVGEYYRSL